jgi:hypothetical protein
MRSIELLRQIGNMKTWLNIAMIQYVDYDVHVYFGFRQVVLLLQKTLLLHGFFFFFEVILLIEF